MMVQNRAEKESLGESSAGGVVVVERLVLKGSGGKGDG